MQATRLPLQNHPAAALYRPELGIWDFRWRGYTGPHAMRKLQLLILAAAVAAGAIWWGFYRTHHTSSLGVASLLPKDTLALLHVPDFNQSRAEWHRTDLYQLWKEPAVQEFLAKPRSKLPTQGRVGQGVEEMAAAEMKDAFFAVISIESNAWKWEGGFRCTGDPDKAAKLVDSWKARLREKAGDGKSETIDYQARKIQMENAGIVSLATVWAGQWFLFANDLENLKALIDRVDGRTKDAATALSSDENFLAASKHMPSSYAALAYGRVDRFVEKVAADKPESAQADQAALLRQIRTVCGATAFDGGRIRDSLFVGMPKVAELGNLARTTLPVATKETFLYVASLLDLRDMGSAWRTPGLGWLGGLQSVAAGMSASGVTLEEWRSAFDTEGALIGSWSANSQWPTLLAAMPVKDAAKANKIMDTVAATKSEDVKWTHREKDGVHYFSSNSGPQLFSLSPTIALSDRMLIAGSDASAIEAAMKRVATGSSELTAARNFQIADRAVPTAQQAFVYADPAFFYSRFDATLRPLLAMGAAFLPAVAETVDISRLPPPEVITRHLTPLVMSQSYRGDGYLAESIGPVPLYQTMLGTVASGMAVAAFYRQQTQGSLPFPARNLAPPAVSPAPSATPEDSP